MNSYRNWIDEEAESPLAQAEYRSLNFIADCEVLRQELQLSYAELARRMGVSRAYVYKLMQGGSNNKLSSLVKLAAALGAEVRLSLEVPRQPKRRRRSGEAA
jgi:predicted transcriptional regulator